MILDERIQFADSRQLGAGIGRQLVGDVIDLRAVEGEVGEIAFAAVVETAFASAGATTVTFELVTDASPTIAVDGSATVLWSSGPIAKAALVHKFRIAAVEIPRAPVPERFLGVIANVAVAGLADGTISAFLARDPARYVAYPSPAQE